MTYPNQRIVLDDGAVNIEAGGQVAQSNYKLIWEWLPQPNLIFEFEHLSVLLPTSNQVRVWNESLDMRNINIILSSMKSAKGTVVEGIEQGKDVPLQRVTFHLANYPKLSQNGWNGRLDLETAEWNISLSLSEQITQAQFLSEFSQQGGYSISYVGQVDRKNGELFGKPEVLELLDAVGFFLSFIAGRWSTPFLLIGHVTSGELVWKYWKRGKVDRFDGHLGDLLVQNVFDINKLWNEFWILWNAPTWQDILRTCTYMYLSANKERTPDISIALAQMALENLAQSLNFKPQAKSPSAFTHSKSLPNFKDMLSAKGIPLEVPSALLNNLYTECCKRHWDGPKALITLRNSLVHRKNRELRLQMTDGVIIEARELGLWYVELLLLKLLEHTTSYRNRLKPFNSYRDLESVPWI